VSLTSSGTVGDLAALASTVPSVTLSSAATVGDNAALAATVPTVTLAGHGEVGIFGAMSATVPTVSLAATGSIGSSAITVDYVANYSQAGDGSTTTWTASGIGIGTADANRIVVVIVYLNGAGTKTVSSVTIGGNAMTQLAWTQGDTETRCAVGVYYRAVSTGTTADVVVTTSGNIDYRFSLDTFALSGTAISAVSGTDYTSSFTGWNGTFTTDVTAGQAVLFVNSGADNTGKPDEVTWTGPTKKNFIDAGNYHYHSVACHIATSDATGYTATVDDGTQIYSGYAHGQVYAIFEPA
jgi:hypothetical protein